jgi:GNAT superfamily N-acetyltransferase
MVPLDPLAIRSLRSWLGEPSGPGVLALHHALAYQRPGVWGDHPRVPRSVVLLRDGDDQLEAFGAGEPEPAVGWLAGQGRAISLVAPSNWREALGTRVGPIEQAVIETWTVDPFDLTMATMFDNPEPQSGPGSGTAAKRAAASKAGSGAKPAAGAESAPPRRLAPTRALIASDAAVFNTTAPVWALRGWGKYSSLIDFGAAFAVPHGSSFAALAWIFDQSAGFDAIAVYTVPRYRRLGLARAAASALISHIARRRRKVPLWSSPADNQASLGLARALGFTAQASEALIRWPPRPRPAALPQPSGEAE